MEPIAARPPASESDPSWSDRLLRRLARTTTSGSFIPEIDGLRTIAVLAVVLFHLDQLTRITVTPDAASRALSQLVTRGFFGVPLFFSISAFIVSLPFAQHHLNSARRVDIGRFYLRRVTRLEPPYILNLLVFWLAGALMGEWTLTDKAPGLLASLVYQHNQIFGYFSTVNSVAWSLEVEFQFYLLAPFLAAVFAVRAVWLRRLLMVAPVVAVVWLRPSNQSRTLLSLVGQCEFFAVGFLVVDVFLTEWRGRLPRRRLWDGVALLGWGGILIAMRWPHPEVRQLLLAFCLLLAALGSLGGAGFARVLGHRWVCTFGGMCYTYYLYHQWLIGNLAPRFIPLTGASGPYWRQFALLFVVIVPVVVIICTGLFVVTEKPFMQRDWPQRLTAWLRKRAGSARGAS